MSSFSHTLSSELEQKRYIIHPQKFALWLSIISLIMIFGGLTSAYAVQRSFIPDPLIFDLPPSLWSNLALILFSSVTMQFSVWAIKRNEKHALIGLGMTLVLGILFLLGQWTAWQEMVDSGLYFIDKERKDNSVAFFYVFSGLHGAHIVAGLLAVSVIGFRSMITPVWDNIQFSISTKAKRIIAIGTFILVEYLIFTQVFEVNLIDWAEKLWMVEDSSAAIAKGSNEAVGMGVSVKVLWILSGPLAAYFLFLTTKFFIKPYKSMEAKILDFQLTSIFWHFLDLLWIYLFLFLIFTQNPA